MQLVTLNRHVSQCILSMTRLVTTRPSLLHQWGLV